MNNGSFLTWYSACATDAGMVRAVNEDAYLDLPELGLWVVADGMGGHEAGDVASHLIVEQLSHLNEPDNLSSFIGEAQKCLREANRQLRVMASQQFNNHTIGSTVAALLAYDKQCAFLWVGDSRIYRLRDNKLEQMTRDHSMIEEYIQNGFMQPEEAVNSNIANILTRAVGAEDELQADTKISDLLDGDMFLLCSDGLYREVPQDDIIELMNHGDDCGTIANNLIHQALNHGAKDNVTVSVVEFKNAYAFA